MKQARFWHYHRSGLVKIKINAGQSLAYAFGGPTDEGSSWEAAAYSFDGRTVTCQWQAWGSDCDGRVSSHGVTYCDVERLSQGYVDDEAGVVFPAWEQGDHGQRDYSAEAAGY